MARMQGFRLGVYVFKEAEVVDYAAPYGVFSVAKRFDPEPGCFSDCRKHAASTNAGWFHRVAQLFIF